jgi:hypothetical protein
MISVAHLLFQLCNSTMPWVSLRMRAVKKTYIHTSLHSTSRSRETPGGAYPSYRRARSAEGPSDNRAFKLTRGTGTMHMDRRCNDSAEAALIRIIMRDRLVSHQHRMVPGLSITPSLLCSSSDRRPIGCVVFRKTVAFPLDHRT